MPALFYVRRLSARGARALFSLLLSAISASALAQAEQGNGSHQSGIVIAGAVARPGVARGPLTVLSAVERAGGLSPQAYALGMVLLRRAPGGLTSDACLARHRSWLSAQLATVPDLDPTIVAFLMEQVGAGRLTRVPVALSSSMKEGSAAESVLLGAGDVLIVPSRPSTIAVVGETLAGAQQWRYEPGMRVEDYLDQYLDPATDQRALALYLPDGRLQQLRLNVWNYERQVVPPGSVIWMGPSRRAKRMCGE